MTYGNSYIFQSDEVWTCTAMKFELVDVSVTLAPNGILELACINFIKSSLTVDNYSNRTQDIDLASQEILITDIRFLGENYIFYSLFIVIIFVVRWLINCFVVLFRSDKPANKRSNVFTNILQPIHYFSESETVQAQIHHR